MLRSGREGVHGLDEPDGANADHVLGGHAAALVLFGKVDHQPQVVGDERRPGRRRLPAAISGQQGFFLLRGQGRRQAGRARQIMGTAAVAQRVAQEPMPEPCADQWNMRSPLLYIYKYRSHQALLSGCPAVRPVRCPAELSSGSGGAAGQQNAARNALLHCRWPALQGAWPGTAGSTQCPAMVVQGTSRTPSPGGGRAARPRQSGRSRNALQRPAAGHRARRGSRPEPRPARSAGPARQKPVSQKGLHRHEGCTVQLQHSGKAAGALHPAKAEQHAAQQGKHCTRRHSQQPARGTAAGRRRGSRSAPRAAARLRTAAGSAAAYHTHSCTKLRRPGTP